ncbi:hypothetical protein ACQ4PT_057617 [Festuca glaucescens]
MASSPVLLLATILLAATSVQARRDSLPPPPAPAPAPAPTSSAPGDGQCTLDGVAELGVCTSLRLGGLGRTSTAARDLCCRRVRGKPIANTVACLCTVFWPFNARSRADVANDVNDILSICGKARVPDPVCLQG